MVSTFAPGRVEILGNHTDYNGGVVLAAAIEPGIRCEGEAATDGKLTLASEGMGEPYVLSASEPLKPLAAWVDYPLGVLWQLRQRGLDPGAFRCRFSSTLPAGAGLSSSAALEVASALFYCRLGAVSLEPMELARLCRAAENEFAGVNCGLLDQATVVHARKNHLVFLDCRSETVALIPLPEGLSFLIIHSGKKHALVGGEYNERRDQCFAAAEALGVAQLRDATSLQVQASSLSGDVRKRALHVTGENERVLKALELLQNGKIEDFGRLLFDSHESSRLLFENSTPELDLLVELARQTPGVLGSRLTGGGFGGATLTLVRSERAKEAAATIQTAYSQKTGLTPRAIICGAADGALASA